MSKDKIELELIDFSKVNDSKDSKDEKTQMNCENGVCSI